MDTSTKILVAVYRESNRVPLVLVATLENYYTAMSSIFEEGEGYLVILEDQQAKDMLALAECNPQPRWEMVQLAAQSTCHQSASFSLSSSGDVEITPLPEWLSPKTSET